MSDPNRRRFLSIAGGLVGTGLFLSRTPQEPGASLARFPSRALDDVVGGPLPSGSSTEVQLSIQEVIDLIIDAIPGGHLEETVDTVKAGDPAQPVRAIATTFLPTSRVIESAAARGVNLIITHEPTYYNHLDDVGWLEGDPVYEAKRRLLAKHQMVVWRFHDYWHRYIPDGITTGALKKLGWEQYARADDINLCDIPPMPLSDLSIQLKDVFGTDTIRVMGDPHMSCARVALLLGAWGGQPQIEYMSRPDVDVLVCGEVREWETTEYVRDAWSAGLRKALVCVGHEPSEEPGMEWLVEWLKPKVPGVDVVHIPAGDPFRYV